MVVLGYKQRMGEGEGMAQSFIGWMMRGNRKGSEKIWAGLAACHMWATAVAFHAGSANGGGGERKVPGRGKETLGKKKGKKGRH